MSKTLVIVESPTKAKTISKFLGSDFRVLSSFGHIRDLPTKKTGVDVKHDFAPTYEVPDKSKKAVADLKAAAKGADDIILATDEDREGEGIAWHIAEVLGLDPSSAKRITFHEITKSAIAEALAHPRVIDQKLVDAQQTRRILDRLVGYELSPFLWKLVRRGLSAGRVQSVALRLIVERERERKAFPIEEYWSIDAEGAAVAGEADAPKFPLALTHVGEKKIDKLDIKTEAEAGAIVANLSGKNGKVISVEKKQVSRAAPAPFTTSSLQIEANGKLSMSAKQTMTLAQKLYETGRITYMRTDSTNLSQQFLESTQAFITKTFGADYATGHKTYHTNKKGAQEAHEAIRPTDVEAHPDMLRAELEPGQWKVYDLIWRRAVASQLPGAKLDRTAVDVEAAGHTLRANGSSVAFDGFMKVYRPATEKILPAFQEGDTVLISSVVPNQHFTEPPARYSDATLVKALEEHGIGRPSTYAPTISTVVDRGYVDRDDNKKLFPTDTGMIVTDVLMEHFPNIVDLDFTAKLEKQLDDVADGELPWVKALKDFYGPFHERIETKEKELTREDVIKVRVLGNDPVTGLEVIATTGRYGPFVQLGRKEEGSKVKPKSASLADNMLLDTVTLEQALTLFTLPRELGLNPEGDMVVAAKGRFGPYLKAGEVTASIPAPYSPYTITLEEAVTVIKENVERKKAAAMPLAELGEDPISKRPIQVKTGRFGPYVTDGETNASVGKKFDPLTITLEEAAAILEKKRHAPPSRFGKSGGARSGSAGKATPEKKVPAKKASKAASKKKGLREPGVEIVE